MVNYSFIDWDTSRLSAKPHLCTLGRVDCDKAILLVNLSQRNALTAKEQETASPVGDYLKGYAENDLIRWTPYNRAQKV